jgi:hypothetical protein
MYNVERAFSFFHFQKNRVSSDVTSSLGGLKKIRTEGERAARGGTHHHATTTGSRSYHDEKSKQIIINEDSK